MNTPDRTSDYTQEELDQMFDEYMSTPLDSENMAEAIEARINEDGYTQWLIPGVLSSELTQVFGQRESGKSTFVREIIAKLSRGEKVFGIEPTTGTKPLNIAVVGTDPGAQEEYVIKLGAIGYDSSRVGVVYAGDGNIPQDLYTRAEYGAVDLVVIDNLAGIAPGKDLNDSASAGVAWLKYEPFIKAKIPVIVVAHSGKGNSDSSAGSHQHEAKPRFRLAVKKSNDKLEVTGSGNLGESKILFDILPGFKLKFNKITTPEQSSPSRSAEVLDANAEIWRLATESRGTTQNAIAKELIKLGHGSRSKIVRALNTGVESGYLVKKESVPIYRFA